MSGEVVGLFEFALIIVGYGVYWYLRPPSIYDPPTESKSAEESKPTDDPFMQEIASEKAHIDKNVSAARLQHECELKELFDKDQFDHDIQLKERLCQFAEDMELDKALIALWKEKESERYHSSRDLDFETWNRMQMSGASKDIGSDRDSIEFMQGTQHFKVTKHTSNYDRSFFVDFSLWESNEEVFAITCSVEFNEAYDKDFSNPRVTAFKKQGSWAKVLLQHYQQIRVQQAKVYPDKYWAAREIKSRFKE